MTPTSQPTMKRPPDKTEKQRQPVHYNKEARREAINELIGTAIIPLAAMAAIDQVKDPEGVSPYAMDVYAIQMHQGPLTDAIVDIAEQYPVLGAVLDKIGKATPFGALAAAVIGLGVQIAENHGALPQTMRGASPTLIPRQDLATAIRKDAARIAANGA